MSFRATAPSSPGMPARRDGGPPAAARHPHLEAAGFGVWQWSAASGTITLSAAAAAAHGIAAGAFTGTLAAFGQLIHPDDRDQAVARLFTVFASGGDRFVAYRSQSPDGSIRWLRTWVGLARDESGAPSGLAAVCLSHDTAAAADHLAGPTPDHLSLVLDGVSDGITVQTAAGDLIYGNAAANRILGLSSIAELQAIPGPERRTRFASTDSAGNLIPGRDFPTARALRGEHPDELLMEFQPLDGSERRWATLQSTPITDDQDRVQLIVNRFRDVTEERRRQEQVRQTAARYRHLFEGHPIPMWVWDTQTLRFLAVNDAAVHQYGWPRDEFLQLSLLDVRPAADQAAILAKVARVAADTGGLDVAGVWRHRRRDGSIFDAEVTTHAMMFDERPARVALINDVTERTRHERRLERLSRLTADLSAALDPGQVARVIGAYAAGAGAEAAAVVAVADGAITVLHRTGVAEPTDAGSPFSIHEPTVIGHVIRTGLPIIAPTWADFLRLQPGLAGSRQIAPELGPGAGVVLPLLVEARPIGALKMAFRESRDFSPAMIDELRTIANLCAQALHRAQLYAGAHAARATAEIGERVARREAARVAILADLSLALAEAGLDVATVLDAVARTIARHTGDACAISIFQEIEEPVTVDTIHHREPTVQAALRTFMAAAWQSQIQTTAARLAATGEAELSPVLDLSLPIPAATPNPDGTLPRVTVFSGMTLPFRVHGRITGAMALLRMTPEHPYTADDLAFFQELSDRAALALDNARLYRETRDAVRARDEFLSAAAHELRTPVTTVKGYAQMLQRAQARGSLASERTAQFLRAIDEATDRLRILTDDLLDVSRLRLGEMPLRLQAVDLLALAGTLVGRYQDQIGGSHRLSIAAGTAPAVVMADPARIEQVLANVLENAAKYSPEGGEIVTTVEAVASGFRISVRDEGIGIPAEATETIFEPFNRAANAIHLNLPGMGLGLYISESIIRRHGGHLIAESAGEGQGTTVHLWLPREGLATVRAAEPSS